MQKKIKSSGPTTITRPLLRWYGQAARELPWRVPPHQSRKGIRADPYHIWLSEVMLQQTTVATIIPRFKRFLQAFPTVHDLAKAPVEAVLHEWAGLGYYARARHLHQCAGIIHEQGGQFPTRQEELLRLPGIGPYTAAAIAAIAFQRHAIVIDGNIERVLSRLFAVDTPLPEAKPELYSYAAKLTPTRRAGDYAQALMDLGAMVCTPKGPRCDQCPLQKLCLAYEKNIAAELPKKHRKQIKPTRTAKAYIIEREGCGDYLLIRRPAAGLLGAMPAFPSSHWETAKVIRDAPPVFAQWHSLGHIKHTFSHFHIVMEVLYAEMSADQASHLSGQWVTDPAQAGLPTLFKKVWEIKQEAERS
ncbi:MAG: A/G-specific adenine glycosylase [bacterium]